MIKILFVADRFGTSGGAEESINEIINGLKGSFKIEQLQGKDSKLSHFNLDYVPFFLKVLRKIKKFKPDLIICQRRMAYPTIIAGWFKKISTIQLIHGTPDICPKYTDINSYGNNCVGLYSRKYCYNCINKWRTLRIQIGNKKIGWEKTLKCSLKTIFYKIRYFLCKFNLKIMKLATVRLVASEEMKGILFPIDTIKFNISPISMVGLPPSCNRIKELLFIASEFENSHKGIDFVKKISTILPEKQILIVGKKYQPKEFNENVTVIGRTQKALLRLIYRFSILTIFPSFSTDGFGRVVVESILNGTPVICSESTGVAYDKIFEDKKYLSILPMDLKLWKNKIIDIFKNKEKYKINNEDIRKISEKFSVNNCVNGLKKIINKILYGMTYDIIMEDCKFFEGIKDNHFVICNYWECGGESLLTWNKTCHNCCLRYVKMDKKIKDTFTLISYVDGEDVGDIVDPYEIPGKVSIWVPKENKIIEKYGDCRYGEGYCFDCDMYNGIIFNKEIQKKRLDCINYNPKE